jgi:hypothetical protein
MIQFRFEKAIPVQDVASIRHGEYEWSKYDYATGCYTSATTNTVVFVKKGSMYPPFRTDDYNEIRQKQTTRT